MKEAMEAVETVVQHDEKEKSYKSVYGPWLMVLYNRNNRKMGNSRYGGKGYGGYGDGSGSITSGSRFEILSDEDIEHEVNNQKKKSHQSSSNHNEVGVFSNFSIEDRGIASRKGKMQANISVPVVQLNVLDDKLDDADVLNGGMIDNHGQKIALGDANFEEDGSRLNEAMIVSVE
ncbi:hypothetical protein ACOSQ2_028673 [Xanthoceras sorbifolium]